MPHDPWNSPTFGNALLLRVDGDIGAMSLAPNGRDALLAGRRGLLVLDMDDPFKAPRLLHHVTSWEVADVQWLPHHATKPSWCILTSNQKALLWDLARLGPSAIINVLHKHTRAISDINFHPQHPEVLATCLIDTYIYSWDMRTPRKPVSQWAQWRAGCTQVKWNHHNPYELASAHDHGLYFWDTRKYALPVLKVHNAHEGKINGIDYTAGLRNLISCSNDRTVKMWDISGALVSKSSAASLIPAVTIRTDFPVARARKIPFGSERACGILPLRGGNNAVHVVNYDAEYQRATQEGAIQTVVEFNSESSYEFVGHDAPVKDFLWRTRHQQYQGFESRSAWNDYQLVTWLSQEYDLRLWPHDDALFRRVAYSPANQQLLSAMRVPHIRQGSSDTITPKEVTRSSTDKLPDLADTRTESGSITPVPHTYSYHTYSQESRILVDDYKRRNHNDLLLSLVSYNLAKRHHDLALAPQSSIDQLQWISGVRLGAHLGQVQGDGPGNLGEEVSIVGHKFPKVHFEKISVSTGKLVINLNGFVLLPAPIVPEKTFENSRRSLKVSTTLIDVETSKTVDSSANPSTTLAPTSTHSANTTSTNIPTQVPAFNTMKLQGTSTTSSNPRQNSASTALLGKASGGDLVTAPDTNAVVRRARDGSLSRHSTASGADDLALTESHLVFIRILIKFPKQYPYLEEFRDRGSPLNSGQKTVTFDIEETHKVTPDLRLEMTRRLDDIAYFYSNKHHQFCLEPCLRYLLGDKIELDDAAMRKSLTGAELESVGEFEVGNENWVDDLIFQQPGFSGSRPASFTSIVHGNDDDDDFDDDDDDDDDELIRQGSKDEPQGMAYNEKFDSTPVPKGCGAMWAPNGQLVCFFIPKSNDAEMPVPLQKFNIFNFTDSGFNARANPAGPKIENADSDIYLINLLENAGASDTNSDLDADSLKLLSLADSFSDGSFSNDWAELVLQDVAPLRHIPGNLMQTSLGISNRYHRQVVSVGGGGLVGAVGTSTQQRLLARGASERRKRSQKARNVVGIFDLAKLIPDKYELAREYRILGSPPEELARHNGAVATKYGLYEIADTWRILEMILVKRLTHDHHHQFFWGTHPFGNTELVPQIFDYYERRGNVQMLAVMSCVLYENRNTIENKARIDDPINAPYKAPAPVLAYVPGTVLASTERLVLRVGSFRSLTRLTTLALFSASETSSFDHTREQSLFRHQALKKGIQTLASPLPQAGDRLSPMLFDNKDFMHGSRLRSSRFKGMLPARSALPPPDHAKHGMGPKYAGALVRNKLRPPPHANVHMYNQNELDLLESAYGQLLLYNIDENKIRQCREQYAEMLYVWGLPLNRIKMLKFNHLDSNATGNTISEHSCRFGVRRKSKQVGLADYVNAATPIATAKDQAWNTLATNPKICVLCQLLVTKNVAPCGQCEHVMHTSCAITWWTDSPECPSGCGCMCLGVS